MTRTKLPAALTSTLLLVALVGTTTIVTGPEEAHAQDDAALQEARSKFQRAIELEAAKNWGGALKLFRDVGQIKMTPQVRYHIATCEENLGKLVAALGGYELALAQAEGMHPDFIAEVQGSIDELKARIPKLVIERGEGAEAASIELDGVALGESSIGGETPVDPGPHAITAKAPGFENYNETVSVSEGSLEVVSITMTPLDDGSGGDAPEPAADPGAESEKKRKTLRTASYATAGGGLLFAGLGAAFLGMSQGKVGKLKEDRLCGEELNCKPLAGTPEDQEARDLHRGAKTFEAVGWAGIGVGLTAIGTGIYLYILSDKSGDEEPVAAGFSVQPHAPSSDAGLSFVGSF